MILLKQVPYTCCKLAGYDIIHHNQDNEDIEDTNITNQDLTREEIEELKKQLELMQRKKNSSITAENDEDNEEGTF